MALTVPVTAVRGGTGQTVYAQGDIIYADTTTSLAKLVKNATATRYLSNTGTSNNPAWAQINLANGVTGALPSSAVGGTTTNDSAAAGVVGQFIESEVLLAAAVTLASGATTNITSVSLTAGDWDVWGLVALELTSTINHFFGALSLVSATFPTYPGKGAMFVLNDTAAIENPASPVGQRRVSVASTTTVWLVGGAGFSAGTAKAYGYIGARRAR